VPRPDLSFVAQKPISILASAERIVQSEKRRSEMAAAFRLCSIRRDR